MVICEYCNDLILLKRLNILKLELTEDFISEAIEFSSDSINESVEIMNESTTNKDMIYIFKNGISEAKKEFNIAKKYIKVKDKEQAIVHFKKCFEIIDNIESNLRKIDDFTASSKLIGNIAGIVVHLGTFLILATVNIINIISGIKGLDKAKMKRLGSIIHLDDEIIDKIEHPELQNIPHNVVKGVKLDYIKIPGISDEETFIKNLKQANTDIKKNTSKIENNIKGLIIPAVVTLIKATKEIIQVSKNGGTKDGFNLLRNKLIVYTKDIKNCIRVYIKIIGISFE